MSPIGRLGQRQGTPRSPLDRLSSFAFEHLMESSQVMPVVTLLRRESMTLKFVLCRLPSPPRSQLHQALSRHACRPNQQLQAQQTNQPQVPQRENQQLVSLRPQSPPRPNQLEPQPGNLQHVSLRPQSPPWPNQQLEPQPANLQHMCPQPSQELQCPPRSQQQESLHHLRRHLRLLDSLHLHRRARRQQVRLGEPCNSVSTCNR
jgi:hypothetical protein